MSNNLPVLVKKVGRPKGSGHKYTEEIADEICERVASGEVLLEVIKYDRWGHEREPGPWPSYLTVYEWADPTAPNHIDSFVHRFARARLIGQEVREEANIIEAKRPRKGIVITHTTGGKDGDTTKEVYSDSVERSKLIIYTNQQYNARVNAQKWAERLQQPQVKDASGDDNTIIVEGGLPDNEPTSTQGDDPPTQE